MRLSLSGSLSVSGDTSLETVPSWRSGMAVNEWTSIAGTAMSDAETASPPAGNPEAIVTAYNGFALDPRDSSLYAVACGGHTDYSGNEALKLGLAVNSPAWVLLRDPTASVSTADHYADGRPASRHTYYTQHVDEANDRVMMFGGSRWQDGAVLPTVDSFNFGSNDYSAAGTHPNMPANLGGVEVKVFGRDPRNGRVYAFANYNVSYWDPASNTWTNVITGQTFDPLNEYVACAWDSTRERFFLLGNGVRAVFDPDLGSSGRTAITISGEDLSTSSHRNLGMVYEPTTDRFLIRQATAGGTVHECTASGTTFTISELTTTGGESIPLTPGSGPGPYTRFLYVPNLQGIVYVADYDSDVWFLRTH